MSLERQATAAGELSRLLQQLGQEPLQPREHEHERERAKAIARHLDRELQSLVRQRRARVWRLVPLAAAAALVLGFAGWQLGVPRAGKLALEHEPLVPGAGSLRRPAPALPEPEAPPQPALRALPDEKSRATTAPSSAAEPAPSASAEARSTLADENRLFKEAAEATRAGDTNGALQQLERLLDTYPSSPLAQTALVRKLRLLAKAGQSEAAASTAKRYLELYPTGFAAHEAEELLRAPAAAASARQP